MKRSILVSAALALLWGGSTSARADFIPAVDFTGGTNSILTNSPETVGYAFTVGASPFAITAVGLEVVSSPSTVRIYQDGQTVDLLTQAIAAGDPTNGSGKYKYHAVTLLLSANTTYDIVYDYPANTNVFINASTVSNDPDITFADSRLAGGTGQHPTSDLFGLGPYFGPAFQGASTAVPEPANLTLLGIGGLGLIGFGWRRRKLPA
jgi:hypothetical protein